MIAVCIAASSGVFDFIGNAVLDARFRLIERKASNDIVVVAIDPKSLRSLDSWPWPRTYHAIAVETLIAAGAKTVAFDVDFSSRSNAAADAALERALAAHAEDVILPVFRQIEEGLDGSPRIVHTQPLEAFRRHTRLASVNVFPAADGLVRAVPVAQLWGRGSVGSLAAALADKPLGDDRPIVVDYSIPASAVPQISFVDILTQNFDASAVRGRSVVIGATAAELGDHFSVPVSRAMPGVLVQALAAETLKGQRLVHARDDVSLAGGIVIAMTIGLAIGGRRWWLGLAAFIATAASLFGLSVVVQASAGLLIDIVPAIVLTALVGALTLVERIDRQAATLLLQRASLRRRDRLMRHVVENSLDGIAMLDSDGTVRSANPAFAATLGRQVGDIIGRHVSTPLQFVAVRAAGVALGEQLQLDGGRFETRCDRADGEVVPLEVTATKLTDAGAQLITVFIRDITERVEHQAALEHQALYDDLTGLANRNLLLDRLAQLIHVARRRDEPFALLLIDLNRFKQINDTLGHDIGDKLLCQVGERLNEHVRASDTVARLGGDEFAVVLAPPTDMSTACELCERLVEAFTEPFALADLVLEVGLSIGVAAFPDHALEPGELLQRGDVAMYVAKHGLHGFSVYDADADHNSVRRLALSGELRTAIEQQQLAVYFQPKVDLERNRACGAEALVRWIHPELGFINPDEFVTMAEQSGLIRPLTLFVLERSLAACTAWRVHHPEAAVAVNLSMRMLQAPDIVDTIASALAGSSLPPSALTLEITESALMGDPARAASAVGALRELGLRLSIDDFGTGFSNLSYLKDLPAQELKIDKSFVAGMLTSSGDATIVQSTLDLAHNLGLRTVAEGIEDAETVEALRQHGCVVGQGYYFGRPMPDDEFVRWLNESVWGKAAAQTAELTL